MNYAVYDTIELMGITYIPKYKTLLTNRNI